MTYSLLPRKSVAQYEIYGYDCYKKSNIPGHNDVEFNLPRTIVLKDATPRPSDSYDEHILSRDNVSLRLKDNMPNQTRRYTWLSNPGCWVEEGELKVIIDSHERFYYGSGQKDDRIWQIYDALSAETVVLLIAESFCERCQHLGLAKVPALKPYDVSMLTKYLTQWCGFPCLHHQYFTKPNNPSVMPEWMYTTKQLLVDTYNI